MGWAAIDWIEHYLCHGPGDVQGEPLVFDDEFAQMLLDVYRLYPKGHVNEGRRVVSYAGWSLPKGRAKSEVAAAVVCFEFLGPCRFDGWKGEEPLGAPVRYPLIRPLATEEGQTGNTYGGVFTMLEHAKEKFGREWRFGELDIGATRTYLGKNGKDGEIRPSTAGAASKDGGKETFAIADEVHLYITTELRSMHSMVRRNTRKRKIAQPWMLATTTMFEPGEGSVAEDLYDEAESLAESPRRHYSFCFHHRQGNIDEKKEWEDDKRQMESLAESYGAAAKWMDLESIVLDEIRAPGAKTAENVRYFHNMKSKGEHKAIDLAKWDALADAKRTPAPSKHVGILIAFDGSDRGEHADDTVLAGWTIETVPHLFLIGRWRRPPRAGREYKVPRHQVRKTVTEVREGYDVRRFVCDPPGWRDEIDGPAEGWVKEFGVDAAGEPLVREFLTNRPSEMGPAIDRFLEAVDEAKFTHDGSPEIREYCEHALLVKAKGGGDYSALAKPAVDQKIDGLVTAVIGYEELADLPVIEPDEPLVLMLGGNQ